MTISKGIEFNDGKKTICNICDKDLIKGEKFFRVSFEEVINPTCWYAGLRTTTIWTNCRVCLNCIKKIKEEVQ